MVEGMQKRIAIYPGTFDPVTNGHLSLIQRALKLFDKLVVAVAMNADKVPFFGFEEREGLMRRALEHEKIDSKVEVIGFDGLLAELAKEWGATAIIRGLRAVSDFEYEFQMALMNRKLARETETVFLMPSLSWVYLSSTVVKDVASHGGDISTLVPPAVKQAFEDRLPADRRTGKA
jgi:pantetheine-phosphate adenylyltransferase